MQLDRTEIVIRQRSALELLDLSLFVLKRHWRPICLSSLLIFVPLLLLDVLAVAWMFGEEAMWATEQIESPEIALRWRHSLHIIFLVTMQFPLTSLPLTIFLGNRIFYEPMPMRMLIQNLWKIAGRSVMVLGIVRLGLVALALEFAVNRSLPFDWLTELWILIFFPLATVVTRACWPYAPEILGLELCPLFSGKKKAVSYSQRSRRLHNLLMADHIARYVVAGFFGFFLLLMLLGMQLWTAGIFTGRWQWGPWCDHFALPFALWIVAQFLGVFRFLAYLDSRIRLEGWEIELYVKAEAERLQRPARISAGESQPEPESIAT